MRRSVLFSRAALSSLVVSLLSLSCHRHPPPPPPPPPPTPPLVSIIRTTPANGETEVAVTRESIIEFALPVKAIGVNRENIFAQFGEDTLAANMRLSPDRKRVTLFYHQPLPANVRVRVTVNGDNLLDDLNRKIDADGDSVAGGVGRIDFYTLGLSRIAGTNVFGYVYDSYNKNPDGTDRPVVGATIRVDGFPEANAVTHDNGYFILRDMPAPEFFVHIDGSTATNAPPGTVYATVGKAFHSVAGRSSQLTMDGQSFNIYLPPMSMGDIKPLSSTTNTDVGFGIAGKVKLVEMFPNISPSVWDQTQVTFPPNSAIDETGKPATQAAIIPVPADRLPAPLSPGLNHQLDIAIVATGATNFDTPAPACFPNLPDPVTGQPLPPGAKSALWSFNHDTGLWEIGGSMTVSADGRLICTDPGVGIRAPGWHGVQAGNQANGGGGSGGGNPNPPCDEATQKQCRRSERDCVWAFVFMELACAACILEPTKISCLTCAAAFGYWIEICSRSDEDCRPCRPQPRGVQTTLQSTGDPFDEARLLREAASPILRDIHAIFLTVAVTGTMTNEQSTKLRENWTQLDQIAGGSFKARVNALANTLATINVSVSATARPSAPVNYGVVTGGRTVIRGRTGLDGSYDLRLGNYPDGVQLLFFDPRSGNIGFSGRLQLPPVGSNFTFPDYILKPAPNATDIDSDALSDFAESVLGTDSVKPDTDGDGIKDGAEVQQGTNPLDGLPAATGIIATAQTPGTAVDIAAFNDIAVVTGQEQGVSVLSVVNGTSPVVIAQVNTPGSAQAVAFAGNLVAVADGAAGLAVIDITDPRTAQIIHQVNLGGVAQAVTTAGPVAYVGLSSEQVVAVDMISGTELARVTIGSGVNDVALGGDYLYVLTNGRLHSVSLDDFSIAGSAASPGFARVKRQRLFVGGGIAYAAQDQGFNTFNLANPAQPVLIAPGNTQQTGWEQIVANGSGLGVAVVGVTPFDQTQDIYLYDVSNPSQTNNFLTAFPTPGFANAVSIYNGLAYVADGQAGIQVINYREYDRFGKPPTITLSTNFAAGVAEEGKAVRVSANVSDDVQVRNVEFYVDTVKVATDGNFPFEYRFITPLRSRQPSFTLRAKATDTGGNSTWTNLMTVTLVADATPPRVARVSPRDASSAAVGSVSGISAAFSEPIDTTKITAATLRLFSAGPDGNSGTSDDTPVTGGLFSYRNEISTALLTFTAPLPPDLYRAVVSSSISDLAGNPIAAEFAWTFRVKTPIFWARDTSGFWDVPANWSTGVIPGADDFVIIDRPAGNFTITYRSGNHAIAALRSSEALVISGGDLSISAMAQINNGLTLSGGTFSGSGDVTLSGASAWTGGTMRGPGATNITAGSTLVINGNVSLVGRTLNNSGVINWAGTNDPFYMYDGAVFNNLSRGLFDIQSNATLSYFSGDVPTFNNAGTVRKSAGTGTTTFGSNVIFSGGRVEVQTGTLTLAATGGPTAGGNFTVASGAVLDLTGGQTRNYVGAYTGTGAGTIRLSNGTLQVGATGATFNFSGNIFQWTGGTITGTSILTNAGTINLSGSNYKSLTGLTLNNTGVINWMGDGIFYMYAGAVLNNLASGLFDIKDNAVLSYFSETAPIFNNTGIVRKSGGTGTTTFGSNVTFSGGRVEVQTGTLILAATGGPTVGGNFTVANGAVLDLTGGQTRHYVGNYTGTGEGTIQLRNGTLQVGTDGATFSFSGNLFQWTGGTLTGSSSLTNAGTMNLAGAGAKSLTTLTLNNLGVMNWTGGGIFYMYAGAVLNNLPSGLFDIQGDASLSYFSETVPRFNNAGIVRKSAGTGTTTFGSNVIFSGGKVEVQTGTLNLAATGGPTVGGNFTVASGAVLDLTGGATRIYSGNFTGTGAGTIRLGNGTLQVGASSADSTAFNFSENLFQWTGGTLTGPSVLTNTGTMNLSGSNPKSLTVLTLNNAGVVNWMGGGIFYMYAGAVLNNLTNGLFDIKDDANLSYFSGTVPKFNNEGIVRKSTGTGATTFGQNVTFSGGKVEVKSGTLILAATGGPTVGGNFTVASGAVLDLTGGVTRNYVGSYTGTGGGTIQLKNGTLQLGASGATFDFSGNLFQWTGGTLTGSSTLTNNGTINLNGPTEKSLTALTFNNAGVVNWMGAGIFYMYTGAVFNNLASGLFDIQNDASLSYFSGTAPKFNNSGIVRKSAGTGTTTFGANVTFANTATVEARAGTLRFTTGYTQSAGTTSLIGGNISAGSDLKIQGGSLSGAGTVTANVVNTSGQVIVGGADSSGVLNIVGTYKQELAGVLNIELGGLTAGVQHDQLTVTGTATFDGTIDIKLIKSFSPNNNDSFQVMTYGSHAGVFKTINGNGRNYTPSYNPKDLALVITLL